MKDAAVARAATVPALQALAPRGPDGSGCQTGDGWVLGHTRLAILDLSERANQPMTDGEGRWLVFNGEIYNFKELRHELTAKGCRFSSTGDSEVLLHALRIWGTSCLPRLRGMFAFAWLDSKRRELLLARDRYGVKPLYYECKGDDWRFASDLFALHALPESSCEIDTESVFLFLGLGYVPAPHSIMQDVRKVKPGCYLRLRWANDGPITCEERPYWSIAEVAPAGVEVNDMPLLDEYEQRLAEAVDYRLISDVPVGSLLSGGIDSTLLTAICHERHPEVATFTMGFEDPAFDESVHARRIAEQLGSEHFEFHIAQADVLAAWTRLWSVYDEPFGDSSALPMIELCRRVSSHVKVALVGDGGDEVFGGYPWHRALDRANDVGRNVPAIFRRWLPSVLAGGSSALRYQSAVLAEPDRIGQWSFLRTGLSAKNARLLPVEGAALQTPFHERFREWARPLENVHDPIDWACRMDLLTYLPDDLMVKSDRASMHVGLELREPLLDHRLTAWCLSLPMASRYERPTRRSKLLSRQALSRRFEQSLVERPKQGFTPPLAAWLKGPLAPWVQDSLTQLKRGELAPLQWPQGFRTWDDYELALNDGHHTGLWRIVCFAEWLRHWRDANSERHVSAGISGGKICSPPETRLYARC